MKKQPLLIGDIPALLWGKASDKLWIAVHGDMSNKEDEVIRLLAQEATAKGAQVLSFDLPEHGERKDASSPCKVQHCVHDLHLIMNHARQSHPHCSLFACSIGAYFSLLAYANEPLEQALFLSPIVDMERIIHYLMQSFHISEAQLKIEQQIATPIGKTLYWDYYCYVKEHLISTWPIQTAVLYGSNDAICDQETIDSFCQKFATHLTIMDEGEHYFHTPEQLAFFKHWLNQHLAL